MTPTELAEILDGTQYPNRELEDRIAENIDAILENDQIIAYPQSDDLIEFRGCIDDEGGHDTLLSEEGTDIYYPECDNDRCPHEQYQIYRLKHVVCEATDEDGWKVELKKSEDGGLETIHTASFQILEGDDVYGTGIVFTVGNVLNA